MAATPLKYHGVGYTDTRLDPATRRMVPTTPVASLRLLPVGTSGKLREVELDRTELVKLIRDATQALARMEGIPRNP